MIVGQTMDGKLKIVGNGLKEESQHTIRKSGWILIIWSDTVHNMHLKVKKLAVDRVFRGGVEVVLETLEFDTPAAFVEQTDGRGDEVVVIWCLILHDKLVLAALLVVLQLLLCVNISILKGEVLVFESLQNGDTGLKIDGCLLDTVANYPLLLLFDQVIVGCQPIVLSELTRSLVQGIHVIFAVVVVIVVLVDVRAARHAANHWHLDTIEVHIHRLVRLNT